jgi:DNA-binding LacI/PurR family transcriptional regulator
MGWCYVMTKRVTLRDVATTAGVSAQTVSRVINGRPDVAEDTRHSVWEAIHRLGYRPNVVARSLVSQRTHTLGVISFPMQDYFLPDLLMSLEHEARERGYVCMFSFTEGDSDDFPRLFDLLVDRRVDGVVLLAPGTLSTRLREIPVPVVSLAHPIEHDRVINIDVDNVDGGYQAMSYLVGLGHRRVGIIAGVAARKAANERNEGARRALNEAGLDLADSWESSHQWSIDAGYRATHSLLERRSDLTALFCHSDTLALGAYRALHELKLSIPQDVSVVGYDDLPICAFTSPPLTSVQQPRESLGRLLAQIVISAIENATVVDEQIVLKARLVIRESTAPPPRGG